MSGSVAITAGILNDSYLSCAQKAIAGILENIAEDGTVLNVSDKKF